MSEISEIGRTSIDDLTPLLKRIGLVDIGIITGFSASTGRAKVSTFQIFGDKQLELADVEVLLPGTTMNGFEGSLVNSPCLIIYPRSVVPSLRDKKVLWTVRPFDAQGVKCIPLSTRPDRSKVHMGFDSAGQFVIGCQAYSVVISETGILYSNADNTLQYDISGSSDSEQITGGGHIHTITGADGSFELYYLDDNGLVAYRVKYMPDGTYTIQRGAHAAWEEEQLDDHDSFTDYAWTTIYQMDGTVTKTLRGPQDGDDEKPIRIEETQPDGTITSTLNSEGDPEKPLWVVTRGADGSVKLTQTNTDGDVLNDVDISAEGDVTIGQTKAENTITLKQDGTLSITTKAAISITGHDALTTTVDKAYDVTSSDAMTLQATKDVTFKSSGSGKLIAGNSTGTLKDILITDLLDTLLSNFDTTGSPAAHMTGPGAKANIATLKTKWGQILG